MANGKVISKEFFAYAIEFASIANGVSQTNSIKIEADSYFNLQKLTYFADIGGAAQTQSSQVVPLITVQITDTGSGRNLFNQAVSIPALFGTGPLPFILPTPKLFKPQSNVSIQIANISNSTTYRIALNLIGQKIFMAS